jgi:hypothetical protein
MVSINLHVPDDVNAKLERRATEHGHASVETYIDALVREDAEWHDGGGPPNVSFQSRAEFEAKLTEGLNSPAREMTDADWERMKDQHRSRSRTR